MNQDAWLNGNPNISETSYSEIPNIRSMKLLREIIHTLTHKINMHNRNINSIDNRSSSYILCRISVDFCRSFPPMLLLRLAGRLLRFPLLPLSPHIPPTPFQYRKQSVLNKDVPPTLSSTLASTASRKPKLCTIDRSVRCCRRLKKLKVKRIVNRRLLDLIMIEMYPLESLLRLLLQRICLERLFKVLLSRRG